MVKTRFVLHYARVRGLVHDNCAAAYGHYLSRMQIYQHPRSDVSIGGVGYGRIASVQDLPPCRQTFAEPYRRAVFLPREQTRAAQNRPHKAAIPCRAAGACDIRQLTQAGKDGAMFLLKTSRLSTKGPPVLTRAALLWQVFFTTQSCRGGHRPPVNGHPTRKRFFGTNTTELTK